ncbi:hypothetical protein QVD17_06072 [Tagetes erecta]|uniref:Uncharacterized protein n=1 Tax=Tagetes erecta TaxID=13708 RepID=A0AAD8LL02_TARER|nr:hypothetical protein QVD17_06072 [Tagetes erecta]
MVKKFEWLRGSIRGRDVEFSGLYNLPLDESSNLRPQQKEGLVCTTTEEMVKNKQQQQHNHHILIAFKTPLLH